MNATTNYQLSQWEAEDRVLRTDFNADNAKIDAALKAIADQAHRAELLIEQANYREYEQLLKKLYAGQSPEQPSHLRYDAFLDTSKIASMSSSLSRKSDRPRLVLDSSGAGTLTSKPFSLPAWQRNFSLWLRHNWDSGYSQKAYIRVDGKGDWRPMTYRYYRVTFDNWGVETCCDTFRITGISYDAPTVEVKLELAKPGLIVYDYALFLG